MKKMSVLLLPALFFTACNGGHTPAPVFVTQVSGTVVEDSTPENTYTLITKAWTGGAGTVVGSVGDSAAQIASGTLSAGGSFSLNLPSSVPENAFTAVGNDFSGDIESLPCTGTQHISDSAARLAVLNLSAIGTRQGSISPTLLSGQLDKQQTGTLQISSGLIVYVDRALTVTAQQTCKSSDFGLPVSGTLNLDLHLVRGWNLLTENSTLKVTSSQATEQFTLQSGRLPTNNWLFASPYGGLTRRHAAQFFK